MALRTILFLVLILFLPLSILHAETVAGVDVPDSARITPEGAELSLNGAGVRSKFFINVYVGALYLAQGATTTEEVLAQTGPKRIIMHILYGEISREKLVSGWNDGFANNLLPGQMAALRGHLDGFNALFETVNRGDVILLDYVPGQGTRVTVKGQTRGVVPGKDFNDALLKIWLGERPASGSLKEAMLGRD